MTRALLIVDVQPDFCEGGALAVSGGNAVAARIREMLAEDADRYAVVVTSQDWHTPGSDNGGHFAAKPDFQGTWPEHCVAETAGAQVHPGLAAALGEVRVPVQAVRKGQDAPAYSAFEGTTAAGERLADVLHRAGVFDLDIVGIASDYCVRATALDAVRLGFTTSVLRGLHAGVDPVSTAAALAEMSAAGILVGPALEPVGDRGAGSRGERK
ncbi:MAG: isochorismatase family protein [Tetrasphaera sp.]